MATYSVADPVTFVSAINETNSYTVPANRFAIVTIRAAKTTAANRFVQVDGNSILGLLGSTGLDETITGVYVGPGGAITRSSTTNFNVTIVGCLFKNSTAS